MPSCATMKLKQEGFSGKETRNRLFFSGFQASEPAAPIANRGCNRMGGNEVLCKGAMGDELWLAAVAVELEFVRLRRREPSDYADRMNCQAV